MFSRCGSLVVLLTVLVVLNACDSGWSEDQEKFIEIYSQVLKTREMIQDTARVRVVVDSIFKANGLDEVKFREQFAKYSKDIDTYRAMMDSVSAKVNK